jgi:hypothetical protein
MLHGFFSADSFFWDPPKHLHDDIFGFRDIFLRVDLVVKDERYIQGWKLGCLLEEVH